MTSNSPCFRGHSNVESTISRYISRAQWGEGDGLSFAHLREIFLLRQNHRERHEVYGCRNVSIFDVMYMYLNTPYIDNNTVIYMSFCYICSTIRLIFIR